MWKLWFGDHQEDCNAWTGLQKLSVKHKECMVDSCFVCANSDCHPALNWLSLREIKCYNIWKDKRNDTTFITQFNNWEWVTSSWRDKIKHCNNYFQHSAAVKWLQTKLFSASNVYRDTFLISLAVIEVFTIYWKIQWSYCKFVLKQFLRSLYKLTWKQIVQVQCWSDCYPCSGDWWRSVADQGEGNGPRVATPPPPPPRILG